MATLLYHIFLKSSLVFEIVLVEVKKYILSTFVSFQLVSTGWPAKCLQKIQVQSKNISRIFHENSSTINGTKKFLHNLTNVISSAYDHQNLRTVVK